MASLLRQLCQHGSVLEIYGTQDARSQLKGVRAKTARALTDSSGLKHKSPLICGISRECNIVEKLPAASDPAKMIITTTEKMIVEVTRTTTAKMAKPHGVPT
jgi:hypothetical protein